MQKGHPKGLYMLFTVEMWERFGYYGMRAILTLYMLKFLNFSVEQAGHVYGWFTGFVYLTPLLGGYIADHYWGQRKCITVGALLMALGYFMLGLSGTLFYPALLVIIFGNGFFKPNISTIVGKLYEPHDPRRDGAFTIFYMGINLGALLSPLIAGTLGEKFGWRYGFWAAAVGMIIGLITYHIMAKRCIGDMCSGPATCSTPMEQGETVHKADDPLTKEEWQRIWVICILTFFSIFFWGAFEQAGSSLTIFADKSTNRMIGGWEFPASWFQMINPLFIMILALPFSSLWIWLAGKNMEPSTPRKFFFGLIFLGTGFALMVMAADLNRRTGAPVSFLWLAGAYLLHTLGELCLSPVGLSMVTKLAPAKYVSFLMGVWLMSSFGGNIMGGMFAGNYDAMDHTLFFMIPTAIAFASALILFLMIKPLKRWMHGA